MAENYQKMWEELETEVKKNISYYKKGITCSLAESIYGEICYKEIQEMMKEIKEKYEE